MQFYFTSKKKICKEKIANSVVTTNVSSGTNHNTGIIKNGINGNNNSVVIQKKDNEIIELLKKQNEMLENENNRLKKIIVKLQKRLKSKD